jgi:PAS domain S-box-containing protein
MQILVIAGGGLVVALVLGGGLWFAFRRGKKKSSASTTKLASSLRDERAKSDIILNSIEDGVVFVGEQGTIQLFNPGAAKITGWEREDAEGLEWKSVFAFVDTKGAELPEEETPFSRALQSGITVRDSAANIKGKSGKVIAASFNVSPILDKENKVTALIAVMRDVSVERQEATQRAEFISTASHEMRTPVAAIEGYLSLALNEKVATIDSRAKDFLEKAHASARHLGELFQDLLTSSKAEDGRLTNHPEVVEMGAFMEQLTSDLHFAAQKKNLELEYMIGNESVVNNNVIDASAPPQFGNEKVVRPLYYVHVDPDRMREVITNLFDNACKYTDKGKVSLGLTGNDNVVQLYVRDTGHGIPPEDVTHLFEKFYRVDNSATRTVGGTGLGLFICRKIVELYHGRIWVESTVDVGSSFYINLPRLSSQKAEAMQAKQASEPKALDSSNGSSSNGDATSAPSNPAS